MSAPEAEGLHDSQEGTEREDAAPATNPTPGQDAAPVADADAAASPGRHRSLGRPGEGRASRPAGGRGDRERRRRRRALMTALRTALLMLVALVVGVAVGLMVYPHLPVPGTKAALFGRTTVDEGELDTPLGTYTYQGTETVVTVREAIEESMSLDAAKNADGSYDVPSVDTVLAVARNRILSDDAAARGIVATDEDALAYAQETLGTQDYAVIASSYNMSAEQVAELMRRSAVLKKLRDEVVTTQQIDEPAAPEAPAEGLEDEPLPEYAAYVIALVGDEWDANANTWARDDGPFREQLLDYTISNEAATYSAAQAAYYVAYTQFSTVQQQISTEWTAYVNDILSEVTVELSSLVA